MSGAAEKKQERVTLELKICERCGGLWLRLQEKSFRTAEAKYREPAEAGAGGKLHWI
ncbi:MAG: hypothetical protein JWO20_1119 [Candidatus Angelobacter sp.]|jgi:Zn-finger nucleic acid-binding protein|nr:hypothetical protein [Candidatus Angelobacter sp.]